MFFTYFSTLVETVTPITTPVVIGGDFNIHMDVNDDRDKKDTQKTMDDLPDPGSLQQHVTEPTHRCRHLLDLIITKTSDSVVPDAKNDDTLPSDHEGVICF